MKTVLVVDDEPGITRYVELSLTEAGYAVLKAESAAEALEIFHKESHSINLVLSDIIMPGEMDGMMMIRAMRVLNPVVKLLFMTGRIRGLPEDLTDTCGQVPKPFSPAQIVKAVHQCLDLDDEGLK
jgi:DNA-binding NtrC family response regulator